MLEQTITQIHAAEESARILIEEARKEKILSETRARKRAESIILAKEKLARQEAKKMIEDAIISAESESKLIEERSISEIKSLQEMTRKKLPEARKLCQ